jgi:two-component system chemotaxis sensor kinase CheA
MDDLLQEFLAETAENLGRLGRDLVTLERNPGDTELLRRIFRVVHTVKGNCGFLGLPRLERVAHHAENLLGKCRDGGIAPTANTVSLILESLDRIRSITGGLAAAGQEPAGDDSALITKLDDAFNGASQAGKAPQSVPVAETEEITETTLRVKVDTLEKLMASVGELVLSRNQLLQAARTADSGVLQAPLHRLSHIVTEVQESVMTARLQPVGQLFGRLPRLVRDVAAALGKQIALEVHGAETELDRQMLDMVRDPLTHLVRNAAGHGIEMPEERRARGKYPEGKITLKAWHDGGKVVIQVSDDGRGLDARAIGEKAVARGLVTPEKLREMGEKQILQFIYMPGFSTAAEVTELSGRGVGLDVVLGNVRRIGGSVEMDSQPDAGASFTLRLPLTVSIVQSLVLSSGGERYALPQAGVREIIRYTRHGAAREEETAGRPVLRLRDVILPLAHLGQLAQTGGGEGIIVVMGDGHAAFGLVADGVLGTEEIVVKPMPAALSHLRLFSGSAILGDGGVVTVLDAGGLAATIGADAFSLAAAQETVKAKPVAEDKSQLLLFRAGAGGTQAVPLPMVYRLEEFEAARIEKSGGTDVVQYRGKLMPLVKTAPLQDTARRKVIVLNDKGTMLGLMVDGIIDIVDEKIALQDLGARPGVLGSAIVKGQAVDIVDTIQLLANARRAPSWASS